jgi:penicillin-binding protein 2
MTRNRFFLAGILVMILIFVFQLIKLQLVQTPAYRKLAEENAARLHPLIAPRGIIYDRLGKVLLKNRPSFSLYVLPHFLPADKKDKVFYRLADILHESKEYLEGIYKENKNPQFEGIRIASELPASMVTRLEEEQVYLPGVEVICSPMRSYPYGSVAAHVLGYIGEVEPDELQALKEKGYRLGDLLGKDGVEKVYDKYLRGVTGGKKIEVDALGRSTRVKETLEPTPGYDLKLTLDLDLQLVAEEALQDWEGAVVVLNPKTGEILAMVSHPAFHPGKKWEEIDQTNHPFMNRALSPYPPGSTFKVVTLSAALQKGITNPKEFITCYGSYRLGTRIADCWLARGHGRLDPIEGLVWSCDVMFYELGKRLGPDVMNEFARQYGLAERTGIDLPQEKRGFIPTSQWKEETQKEPWYEGDSINMGIGQGFVQVTPLQMAVIFATLATGRRMTPYVVKEVVDKKGQMLYSAEPKEVALAPINPEYLFLIRKALEDVVWRGTGVAAYVPGFPAAGKTGTAQNPGLPHAWFMCYAPTDDPEIVVVTFVAHGEHGDRTPAYVTRDILKWYKENRFNRKLEEVEREPQYILHGKVKEWYRP